jgi:4-hydroxy-3-polyprenylbenzoate decarboxylase
MKPHFLASQREYIEALRELGEVQPIAREVDWNLEMGAIIRRVYETGSPAPLFENVAGTPKGFQAFGAPAGLSFRHRSALVRVAVSLGLPPEATGRDIVEAMAAARTRAAVPPRIVANGPCKENKWFGDEIDITRFPSPIPHDGDGGRYINTYGIIVARTPDSAWTSWSIARIMVVDRTRMTGIVHPLQHVGMVHAAWKAIGKPMPFALALGVPPAAAFVGGMPLPAKISEVEYLGAYMEQAMEVVRCESVDLEVPATSEIVIEGYLSDSEVSPEGPMGEYAGYLFKGEPRNQPTYNVTAVTFRDNPVLPVVVAGEPVEEDHTAWGIPAAAEVLHELRTAGLPVTTTWIPLETSIHWLVITVPRTWRESGLRTVDELIHRISEVVFRSKASIPIPKVLLVNDDVDPTNLKELVWAYATRCHPGNGEVLFNKEVISPLVAFYTSSEKMVGTGTKAIYNCLPPEEWGDRLPVRSSFAHAYPAELQKRVLENWSDYGYMERK